MAVDNPSTQHQITRIATPLSHSQLTNKDLMAGRKFVEAQIGSAPSTTAWQIHPISQSTIRWTITYKVRVSFTASASRICSYGAMTTKVLIASSQHAPNILCGLS